MEDSSIWELEVMFLAQHWHPLLMDEIVAFYSQRMSLCSSCKAAFAETYEMYFLNPSAEGAHR